MMVSYDLPVVKGYLPKYMASREWALKREAVKERANNICERCYDAYIDNVHHLSYEHLGAEPLDELQGLCRPCHAFISAKSSDDPLQLLMLRLLKQGVSLLLPQDSGRSLPWFTTSENQFGFYFCVWFGPAQGRCCELHLSLSNNLVAHFAPFHAK